MTWSVYGCWQADIARTQQNSDRNCQSASNTVDINNMTGTAKSCTGQNSDRNCQSASNTVDINNMTGTAKSCTGQNSDRNCQSASNTVDINNMTGTAKSCTNKYGDRRQAFADTQKNGVSKYLPAECNKFKPIRVRWNPLNESDSKIR